jgi:hypothetical protein
LPFRQIFISGSWLLSSRIRSQHCSRIFSENKVKEGSQQENLGMNAPYPDIGKGSMHGVAARLPNHSHDLTMGKGLVTGAEDGLHPAKSNALVFKNMNH